MKDPTRLSAEAGDFEKRLLLSAKRARPSKESYRRVAGALGIGTAALTTTTAVASAAAGAGAGSIATLGSKIALIAVLGVAALGVSAAIARSRDRGVGEGQESPADVAPLPSVLPEATPTAAPPATTSASDAPVETELPPEPTAAPTARSRSAPAPSASSSATAKASNLPRETMAIDAARTALRANDPARAVRALDAYNREFPRGILSAEARVLRIEALRKLGQGGSADVMTEDFLRKQPRHPLSDRVRGLSKESTSNP